MLMALDGVSLDSVQGSSPPRVAEPIASRREPDSLPFRRPEDVGRGRRSWHQKAKMDWRKRALCNALVEPCCLQSEP